MTLVMRKDDNGMLVAHDDQNKILSYCDSRNGAWEMELATFNQPKIRSRVHLRNNLHDTGVVVCSPSVPAIFSDASNLDLATLSEFVKRMLDDAAIGGQEVLFSLIEEDEYAKEIDSFDALMECSKAIFNRECYPYTPSYFMRGFKQYNAKKKEVYRGDNVKCSPLVHLSKQCLLGHGSTVKANAKIEYSTIGDDCVIGEGATIINSIVMSGSTVGAGVTLRNSILAPGVVITDGSQVPTGSVLGQGVKLSLEKSDESYPLLLSDVRTRPARDLDSGSVSSDQSDDELEDEDSHYRPICAPEHVATEGLFHWVAVDATDGGDVSEAESCSTTENVYNMDKSAKMIWGGNLEVSEDVGNDRDSLISEESDDSDSESDWEVGSGDELDEEAIQRKKEEEIRKKKADNYSRFETEVRYSINRCLENNLDSADIAPEISGSRSSYEIEGEQIIQALVKVVVELCTPGGKFSVALFKQNATKLHGMFARFLCPNDEPSLKLQVQCLHEIHKHWGTMLTASIHVVHFMYDQDLLEGQIITLWFNKYANELREEFKVNMTRLIDHLEESSEEEEDSDE